MNSRRRLVFLIVGGLYAASSATAAALVSMPEVDALTTRQWVLTVALSINAGLGVVAGILPTLYGVALPPIPKP